MNPSGSEEKKPDNFMALAARYTAVAMSLPAATFAGYFLGYWLDSWLGTSYLKIVFLLLGAASGFAELIYLVLRGSRDDSKLK